jgi:hypothetical protein
MDNSECDGHFISVIGTQVKKFKYFYGPSSIHFLKRKEQKEAFLKSFLILKCG